MDLFRADLHLHSRFSRATSKGLTPRHLAAWARVKGISLLGTGDFTHPGWLAELKDQLVPDDSGLLKLAKDTPLTREIPWLGEVLPKGRIRFMLQAEISSIYSQGGQVRKIHNLVFVPDFEAAERFNERLAKVGNLASDGRPILGLPSKDLLAMVLDLDPAAFLVPAHVWTPWFSLFGSKSGFDAIEECFGDLAGEIFALETGLSSDPAMNRLWSALDRFRLISNSDAHSGEKLGREANVFSGELSYETVLRALKGEGFGSRFLGTVEFFPEEGKYHLDGHRKCGVVLEPEESKARGELCPVCGKPLTVGVLHRVMDLADRAEPATPQGQPGFVSLIPLAEIIGEVVGSGPATKAARALYLKCLSRLGPEMTILQETSLADLKTVNPVLAEAVSRMRQGLVRREPGFDGQYGKITVFSPTEAKELKGGRLMISLPERPAPRPAAGAPVPAAAPAGEKPAPEPEIAYNPAQQEAIAAGPGPVLVLAGPGTGKTQTLMGRIASLIRQGVSPRHILALTFTRRAADELRERLAATLGEDAGLPRADTLHALAFDYWAGAYSEAPVIMTEESAIKVFAAANPELPAARVKAAWQAVSLARERLTPPEGELQPLALAYAKERASWNLVDYTDLLEFWLEQIKDKIYISPYTHVLVDEVQDLTPLQLAVIKALAGPEGRWLFAIGDPDQSIYSFRGAAADVSADLASHWPDLRIVRLAENYRSAQQILDLSAAALSTAPLVGRRSESGVVQVFTAPSSASEASWVGERVKRLLGPTSSTLADDEAGGLSPGEIAVLVRVKALIPLLERTLDRLGVPVAVPEAEAFWLEPRVAAILRTASRFLGMSLDDTDVLEVPEKVLVKGPLSLAAYLTDIPPFDRMFWTSREFKAFGRAFDAHGGWVGLINWINLQSELEQVSRRAEKVQIMSLHAAKGLEFTAVFLPALEDGILPFAGAGFLTGKPNGEVPDVNEERRLFYVGLTRARRLLYLSLAQRREIYGREHRLPVSRFLESLPRDNLERSALVARTQRQEEQLKLF